MIIVLIERVGRDGVRISFDNRLSVNMQINEVTSLDAIRARVASLEEDDELAGDFNRIKLLEGTEL